jgi:hypothetical protein
MARRLLYVLRSSTNPHWRYIMKQMTKFAVAMTLALSAVGASANTITTPDGTFDFGGFDWDSAGGSVLVQSYDILAGGAGRTGQTDLFTLDFQTFAANIKNSSGVNLLTPSLRAGSGAGYEFTMVAHLNENLTCLTSNCGVTQLDVLNGTWDVYYQAAGNALASGTGFIDGIKVLSGTFRDSLTVDSDHSQAVIGAQGTSNPGNVSLNAALIGDVTYTNLAFINPALLLTDAVTTLQFGTRTTSWTRPTNFDGIGATAPDTNTTFVGQADANQAFEKTVPEPATLALMGLGLLGLGMARKSKKA